MRVTRKYLLSPNRETSSAIYHCVSRVVWREFIFQKEEKEYFRKVMRQYERYCGVRVLAYCLMSNHFHIMVEVPPRPSKVMGDERFLEHLELIYSQSHVADVKRWLAQCRAIKNSADRQEAVRELKERYTRRMWDLSEYMKAVKQKFTQWYNKRMGLSGTLWEGRFKSVLVEDGYAARMTAAYIDLNPLRAGMVSDPKDYRWSSYGEACAGGELAQQGLLRVMQKKEEEVPNAASSLLWSNVRNAYRILMAEEGQATDLESSPALGERQSSLYKKRKGFSSEDAQKIIDNGGKLTATQMLHCKTRYFIDGTVLGSRSFVDEFFDKMKSARPREHVKRKTGARKLRHVQKCKLYSLRDLRKEVHG